MLLIDLNLSGKESNVFSVLSQDRRKDSLSVSGNVSSHTLAASHITTESSIDSAALSRDFMNFSLNPPWVHSRYRLVLSVLSIMDANITDVLSLITWASTQLLG